MSLAVERPPFSGNLVSCIDLMVKASCDVFHRQTGNQRCPQTSVIHLFSACTSTPGSSHGPPSHETALLFVSSMSSTSSPSFHLSLCSRVVHHGPQVMSNGLPDLFLPCCPLLPSFSHVSSTYVSFLSLPSLSFYLSVSSSTSPLCHCGN